MGKYMIQCQQIYKTGEKEVLTVTEQKCVRELPACPVETTLMLIGDKWKVLILRDLLSDTK